MHGIILKMTRGLFTNKVMCNNYNSKCLQTDLSILTIAVERIPFVVCHGVDFHEI